MAGTLLHITLANLAFQRATLSPDIRKEVETAADDFRLGSILFDLPYYERLLRQGIARMRRRDFQYGTWGTLLHTRSPMGLCIYLLREAGCAAERAFALGALTHAATDEIFHPEIERRVQLTETGRAAPNRMHHVIETQMDIHIHKRLIGGTGIGTPYARQALHLLPEGEWSAFLERAVFFVHGASPTRPRIQSWLRGVHLFGLLHSVSGPFWVSVESEPDADRDRTARSLFEDALARSVRYLEIGCTYLEQPGIVPSVLDTLPDTNLLSGAPAEPSFIHL